MIYKANQPWGKTRENNIDIQAPMWMGARFLYNDHGSPRCIVECTPSFQEVGFIN